MKPNKHFVKGGVAGGVLHTYEIDMMKPPFTINVC